MIATFVPAKRTPYSIELLDQSLTDGLAAKIGKRPSIETRAVALAKVRLESGNGTACWNHNLGNVKSPDSYIGNFTCVTLNEVLGGRVVWFAPEGELTASPSGGGKLKGAPIPVPDGHPQTRMVARANPTDAGYFYIDFVAGSARYAKAFQALLAGNPEAYARELGAAGYYTAPIEQYTATVTKLFAESLARLRGEQAEIIDQPSKNDWHVEAVLAAESYDLTQSMLDDKNAALNGDDS